MKSISTTSVIQGAAALGILLTLSACSQDAQQARMDSLQRRQDFYDSNAQARAERQRLRSDRADARSDALMSSW